MRATAKGFQHEFRDIMDVQSILYHKNVHILRQTILVVFSVGIILCSSLRQKLTSFSGSTYLIILYYIISSMFWIRSSHREGDKQNNRSIYLCNHTGERHTELSLYMG